MSFVLISQNDKIWIYQLLNNRFSNIIYFDV